MNKKYNQLIKKHIKIIKSTYPEVYVEVKMIYGNILIGIGSQYISDEDEVKYETLIVDFIKEYHDKGVFNILWAVDSSVANDNLHLIEDYAKTPKKVKVSA